MAISQAATTSWLRVHGNVVGTILVAATGVEHVPCWGLHFLVEVKHLHDVSLLAVAMTPRVPLLFLLRLLVTILIAKQIVLGLVTSRTCLMALFLVATWNTISVQSLVVRTRHDHLDCLKILG